ncbi:MAG: hypothetical protein COV59_00420 [Candidatus Magasanikbacteria bacterium CG11_big_fil_rev_8_21_14_0_20_39_34]|uniref:Uncharacterized protein n=1 Tax=Candidatus Magasanikbacteria bacterium CG11_big_fil_rev_8_21_14_0_20_39_34 TaxID=1974653 RepID=A0A2H0N8Y9_9BACT|nr:MAG: hypothetical protein COV59_00420 [Candidatus Magasanikbacteria bacterium CG11_big_fil_rev_8_21_14_0_20_39_34]
MIVLEAVLLPHGIHFVLWKDGYSVNSQVFHLGDPTIESMVLSWLGDLGIPLERRGSLFDTAVIGALFKSLRTRNSQLRDF